MIAAILCGAMPTASEAQTSSLPRSPDGHPNLNGIWQSLNTANWDIQEHAARSGPVLALGAIGAVPPDKLGRGKIIVSARRDGKDIVIDVIDNGIGLPKENRARLLEPYVTTREKGTGLGLAIVGRILEEHGGRIDLRDAADKIPGARGAWMQLRIAAESVAAAELVEPQQAVV